ncbi:TPA_asm: DUF2800 domain-containing protein [Listeria monocytogenes]|uniref:Conserved phage-associated protein n=1 Tax=Listeria monocytogenes serotype 4a (strain M7) TaxID=1030009 RepID=A0A0E0URR0_LISMM|nr:MULTISPECIES: DUF2800 domain-containing protein [Listeria]ACK40923.1 conserved phage-associated protein [Listeria monocytogenes HCC23]AEH91082.1 conserved phage-associated protein [Listeria monocytogenes M7]EAC6859815.1 DUF2800 domain-containing protein [Listeria monocytogenes]EAD0182447.1 DUF2800 domain-containing protein [Listeria monocytogenes]EAD7616317.1 DUF2800 domain-containing protein [Listeria monocytogenes]
MPEIHAKLSASGSSRWLNCTPSIALEAKFPEQKNGGVFAQEGTLAHSFAELLLQKFNDEVTKAGYARKLNRLKKNSLYDASMIDHVEVYTTIVIEKFQEAHAADKNAVLSIEQQLDYSDYARGGFGTGDAVIVGNGVVEIIDLKYGKGVPVSAEENSQLMLYGLGAYNAFELDYDLHTVRMTIVQPRLDDVTEFEMEVSDLLDWAENVVKPAALLADAGKGELNPGPWCKFCRARSICKARAEANLALTSYDFKDPRLLQPDEIAKVLGQVAELKSWVEDVKSFALKEAESRGIEFPGWKLVEGRSNRRYADAEMVQAMMELEGYSEEELLSKKLISLTDMEKLIGKKQVSAILGDLIEKPAGKPALVVETDRRQALKLKSDAADDFADDLED